MNSVAANLGISLQSLPGWVLALCLLQAVTLVVLISVFRQQTHQARRWQRLLRDVSGQNLLELLEQSIEMNRRQEDHLSSLETRVSNLDARMNKSIRKIGLIKYDAFPDVGGQQSFALAMMDDGGDGAVLTGQCGRSESRIFAKPLTEKQARVALTQEELAAIQAAEGWD